LDKEARRVRALRDELWDLLREGIPGIRLNGHVTDRLPNTLNVSFPGVRGSSILAAAVEIAGSTGSACHEGEESPSAVLLAMGLNVETALGAVRLSLGRPTASGDVHQAAHSLIQAWRGFRSAPTQRFKSIGT
jgi:cysteine desulfurase